MPMTFAHPAAVLPLRRLGLPMSALVIGSMVPDVPLFLRWGEGYDLSHSYAGVISVDVVAALALLSCWNAVLRDALVDLAPEPVRSRLERRHRLSSRQWLWAPVAASVGAFTHVTWDAFTHPHRWGVMRVDWLRADLGPLPGFKWLQYLSGVLGLLVVLGAGIAFLRSRPVTRVARPRVLPTSLLVLVVGAAAGAGLLEGLARVDRGLHAVAFHGTVRGISALAVGTAGTCLLWFLFARRKVPAPGQDEVPAPRDVP